MINEVTGYPSMRDAQQYKPLSKPVDKPTDDTIELPPSVTQSMFQSISKYISSVLSPTEGRRQDTDHYQSPSFKQKSKNTRYENNDCHTPDSETVPNLKDISIIQPAPLGKKNHRL